MSWGKEQRRHFAIEAVDRTGGPETHRMLGERLSEALVSEHILDILAGQCEKLLPVLQTAGVQQLARSVREIAAQYVQTGARPKLSEIEADLPEETPKEEGK